MPEFHTQSPGARLKHQHVAAQHGVQLLAGQKRPHSQRLWRSTRTRTGTPGGADPVGRPTQPETRQNPPEPDALAQSQSAARTVVVAPARSGAGSRSPRCNRPGSGARGPLCAQGRGGPRDVRGLPRRAGLPAAVLARLGLDPIEQLRVDLKALLRTAAARTVDTLWAAIGTLLETFEPDECTN